MTLILAEISEERILVTFHTGAIGIGQCSLGMLTPNIILARLMYLYGKPSIPDLERTLSKVNDPMDRMAIIKVMLRDIEAIHFLVANPN